MLQRVTYPTVKINQKKISPRQPVENVKNTDMHIIFLSSD